MPSSTRHARSSSNSHHATPSAQKTEVRIHVYDLLPPGRLSSFLWFIGGPLLHTGVVVRDKEYAFGGHQREGATGVYWTRPRLEPPGGTFRSEILHGFCLLNEAETEEVIRKAAHRFLGTSYTLLTQNCNHFTSYLCERLTSRPAPRWINRAAAIGVALPCMVPREWVAPPDVETADGELVDEEDDERAVMLRTEYQRKVRAVSDGEQRSWEVEMDRISQGGRTDSIASLEGPVNDGVRRYLPASERAPVPHRR
ncbi:DUF862-domain-containing protein [Eremomyces bilateralis CBS 781.70]|uniref:DUF862-domain-containing protein n=1 Tax=Eremomyces bilateralis CBS 781.70 TaxID=1392243 RepID=A0A6G1G8Y2_9PEZI|nr:DUF862-domain-containing protein [Eremomyces bilateralis CBS 781.70]KAF1814319.1 DUF862-domain-containing protein [Eremomyces bilateralis CBS 781.70]